MESTGDDACPDNGISSTTSVESSTNPEISSTSEIVTSTSDGDATTACQVSTSVENKDEAVTSSNSAVHQDDVQNDHISDSEDNLDSENADEKFSDAQDNLIDSSTDKPSVPETSQCDSTRAEDVLSEDLKICHIDGNSECDPPVESSDTFNEIVMEESCSSNVDVAPNSVEDCASFETPSVETQETSGEVIDIAETEPEVAAPDVEIESVTPVNEEECDTNEVQDVPDNNKPISDEHNDAVDEESIDKPRDDSTDLNESNESEENVLNYQTDEYYTVEEEGQDVEEYSDVGEYVEGNVLTDEETGEDEVGGEENQETVATEEEDKRNPQYIPKKGFFYEHDDRLDDEPAKGPAAEEEEEPSDNNDKKTDPPIKNKKLWQVEDKWGHDKFDEDEQQPKMSNELVDAYGYNIREESGPPKARRRRRYGRGPNKYDRNWEDEQAYNPRVRGGFRGRGRGGRRPQNVSGSPIHDEEEKCEVEADKNTEFAKEDFPTVQESNNRPRNSGTNVRGRSSFRPNRRGAGPINRDNYQNAPPRRGTSYNNSQKNFPRRDEPRQSEMSEYRRTRPNYRPLRGNVGSGRTFIRREQGKGVNAEPASIESHNTSTNREPIESHNVPTNRKPVESHNLQTNRRPVEERHPPRDYNRMATSPREPTNSSNPSPNNVEQKSPREKSTKNVPPRLIPQQKSQANDSLGNRPKRYSSLRQRNLPESPGSNYPTEQNSKRNEYYDAAGNYSKDNSRVPQGNGQPIIPPVLKGAGTYHPNYNNQNFSSVPPNLPNPTQPPAQIYNAAHPMPAQYIAPAPNNISYGPPPAASYGGNVAPFPAPPAAYQTGQSFVSSAPTAAPVPVSQPQEVFHGGMAFYNTHVQSFGRNAPNKRPKAAIPIVSPPEYQDNGLSEDKFEEIQFTLKDIDPVDGEDAQAYN